MIKNLPVFYPWGYSPRYRKVFILIYISSFLFTAGAIDVSAL